MYKLTFILCCAICITSSSPVNAQNLSLPVLEISISADYLDSLNTNPISNTTYPARFRYDNNRDYYCEVRYRGNTNRRNPKHSWKVFFRENGPEGKSEINLNAEYIDRSYCRNFLSMELSELCNLPTVERRFVSLIVNNDYYGVYVELESIDEDFFRNRDLSSISLFKATIHGARFAPPLNCDELTRFYEPKYLYRGALDTLGRRFAYMQNVDFSREENELPQMLDVYNFLNYFAIQYCIANDDGFTKNYYLSEDRDNIYTLIHWDGDCTFGNNYRGDWVGGAEKIGFNLLNQQAVFQRLISIPEYREFLLDRIEYIITQGFDHVIETVEDKYEQIRNDVYLDRMKRCTNEEFDAELGRLRGFLEERSEHLEGLDLFGRFEIGSVSVEPDYLTQQADSFTVRVVLDRSGVSVRLILIDASGSVESIGLNDDGIQGDIMPSDMVYSLKTSITDMIPPYHYCISVKPRVGEIFFTPPGGYSFYPDISLSMPSIRVDSLPPQSFDVSIGCFSTNEEIGVHSFCLTNMRSDSIDLSGCVVQLGNTFRSLTLPDLPRMGFNESLLVSNNEEWFHSRFPECQNVGGFYFTPQIGDTLYLKSPSGSPLSSVVVRSIQCLTDMAGAVVINEINYNSADNFDTGDWIELFANAGPVNIGGWILKDNSDDHSFEIPDPMVMQEGDYLVLAVDTFAFRRLVHDMEITVLGELGFGFGGTGDEVRLFNADNELIDWVNYDDDDPWPEKPDGDGPTLELINPLMDNFGPLNWRSSKSPYEHGTPGFLNSTYRDTVDTSSVSESDLWRISEISPNPFSEITNIKIDIPEPSHVQLAIYDLNGRLVAELPFTNSTSGEHSVHWNGRNLYGMNASSGIYFVRVNKPCTGKTRKVVLIR